MQHFVADPRVAHVALVESLATPRFRTRGRELVERFSEFAAPLLAAVEGDAAEGQRSVDRSAMVGALGETELRVCAESAHALRNMKHYGA